jgi:hypothetical protein
MLQQEQGYHGACGTKNNKKESLLQSIARQTSVKNHHEATIATVVCESHRAESPYNRGT